MLAGQYRLTVAKGWRMTIPEFCRAAFPLRQLVVTFKERPTHWLIYPVAAWEKEQAALTKSQDHEALRCIARAETIQFDWNGRFTLPPNMRSFGLRAFGVPPFPVVLCGMLGYGELWRREAWDAQAGTFLDAGPAFEIPPAVIAAMDAMDKNTIKIEAKKLRDKWDAQNKAMSAREAKSP